MSPYENLRRQLLVNLAQLHILILRYAAGDESLREERDQLEGAVEVKMAMLRGAKTSS